MPELSKHSIFFFFLIILTFVLHSGPEAAMTAHKNREEWCRSERSAHTLPTPVDTSRLLTIWLIPGVH